MHLRSVDGRATSASKALPNWGSDYLLVRLPTKKNSGLPMDVNVRRAIIDELRLRAVDVLTAHNYGARHLADPAC